MAKTAPVHSKLIMAAARSVLRPMGLTQKGRSRILLDDRQWWVCVVEFQPSSWSRGSYLNVGCMWLWCVKDYISFDEGHRVESFVDFQNEDQFEKAATQLADRAAIEVARYRALFPNIGKTCEYYLQQDLTQGWPCYHAAIACALAKKADAARSLFERFVEPKGNNAFVAAAQDESKQLALLVGTDRFQDVIADKIRQTREMQKLQAIESVKFE